MDLRPKEFVPSDLITTLNNIDRLFREASQKRPLVDVSPQPPARQKPTLTVIEGGRSDG